jgi:plastocyanin
MPTRITLLLALLALCAFVAAGCGDDDDDGGGGGSSNASAESSDDNGDGGGGYGGYGSDTGGGSGGGGGASTLKLAADPSGALKFDKTSLSAKAGEVTIDMDNPSDVPHAVEIEGNGVEEEGETVGKGGVSTVTADLEPGEYEFYCPVGNHEAAGMKGTLTVK